jgi:hypothetical protein
MTDEIKRLVPRFAKTGNAAALRHIEAERRAASTAVGDTLSVHHLEDDSRWEPTEIHPDDVPLGAAVARGLEQLEAGTIAGSDARHGKRRVGRIVELEAALRAAAERSVEHHAERDAQQRMIEALRSKLGGRPRTVLGVVAQAARGLLEIARGRR